MACTPASGKKRKPDDDDEEDGFPDDDRSNSSQATVKCAKCLEDVLPTALEAGSREKWTLGKRCQLVCCCCSLNYKCLTRRWKLNGRLKQWWHNKTDKEKTAWYQDHKRIGVGASDAASSHSAPRINFTGVERLVRSIGQERKRRCQPRAEWERDQCIVSMEFQKNSAEERNAEWNRILLTNAPNKKVDGVWCIGKFAGLIEDIVEKDTFETSMDRTAEATSSDSAAALQAHGKASIETATEHYEDLACCDALRLVGADVLEDLVQGVQASARSATNFVLEGLLETIASKAEAQEDLEQLYEQLYLKESMEAEAIADESSGTKTLGKFQIATLKSKMEKARQRLVASIDIDLATANELSVYAKELGSTPKDYEAMVKEVIEMGPKVKTDVTKLWTDIQEKLTTAPESCDSWMAELRTVRKASGEQVKPLKSSLTSLRGLLAKH